MSASIKHFRFLFMLTHLVIIVIAIATFVSTDVRSRRWLGIFPNTMMERHFSMVFEQMSG
jgi:hypothetical protein